MSDFDKIIRGPKQAFTPQSNDLRKSFDIQNIHAMKDPITYTWKPKDNTLIQSRLSVEKDSLEREQANFT